MDTLPERADVLQQVSQSLGVSPRTLVRRAAAQGLHIPEELLSVRLPEQPPQPTRKGSVRAKFEAMGISADSFYGVRRTHPELSDDQVVEHIRAFRRRQRARR